MAYSTARSSFFCPSGKKWYWEYLVSSGSANTANGITTNSAALDVNPGGTTDGHGVGFYIDEVDHDGTRSSGLLTASSDGDIIGVGYDVDGNSLRYYLNGTLDYTYTSVPTSTDGLYSPSFGDFSGAGSATTVVNFGQDSSFAGNETAQGNQDSNEVGDFYYEPPTDYLALCTNNLASESAGTFSYVGNGNADGPFVYMGYAPSSITISSVTYDIPTAGNPSDSLDWLANGIKIRSSSVRNTATTTYSITSAPIEQDFKHGNAR